MKKTIIDIQPILNRLMACPEEFSVYDNNAIMYANNSNAIITVRVEGLVIFGYTITINDSHFRISVKQARSLKRLIHNLKDYKRRQETRRIIDIVNSVNK